MKRIIYIFIIACFCTACDKDSNPEVIEALILDNNVEIYIPSYRDWLGTWSSNGRTVTLKEKIEGVSYTMTDSGYGKHSDTFKPTVLYNPLDGTLRFCHQELSKNNNDTFYFSGGAENNIYTGLSQTEHRVATAKMKSDGLSFTIRGETYTEEGETIVVKLISVFDYLSVKTNGYDPGWYTIKDITDLALPATFKR